MTHPFRETDDEKDQEKEPSEDEKFETSKRNKDEDGKTHGRDFTQSNLKAPKRSIKMKVENHYAMMIRHGERRDYVG